MLEVESDYKEIKMNSIQRFFIGCSGAVDEAIQECPTEWTKYIGIGATILFTGLLAFFSGGYALYTIFRDTNLDTLDGAALCFAIPFGLLWGAIIFNLDRFIVSTFYKTNERNFWKRLGKELLQALPRLILAVIIAFVISKPIEIKIFENRISEQIKQNEINAKLNKIGDIGQIHGVGDKEMRVNWLESDITKLQTELVNDPPIVLSLINNDLEIANNDLTTTRNSNESRIRANENALLDISKNPNSYIIETDTLGNTTNTGRYTQVVLDRRNALLREIQGWQREINDKRNVVNRINERIVQERASYRLHISKELEERRQEKDSAQVQWRTAIVQADIEAEEANKTSQRAFSNTFISQIEALGNYRDENPAMNIVGWFITMLFLAIELAPILTKLITKRGPYDETLERIEHEIYIEQKQKISNVNAEYLELLKTSDELAVIKRETLVNIKKKEAELQLQTNDFINKELAKKQQELVLSEIEEWYKKKKAELAEAGER